jgi:hypothetical protein
MGGTGHATLGGLAINSNGSLANVDLPVLTTLPGGLLVGGNTALTSVNLPALTTVSFEMSLDDNPALTGLKLPALTTARALSLRNNTSLVSVDLPVLVSIGPSCGWMFPCTNGLRIAGNTALTSVSAPALLTCNDFFIVTSNTLFPQCRAQAILAQLAASPPTVDISGNDTAAPCP